MFARSRLFLKPSIFSAAEAVKDIPNGATIAAGGFGLCGVAFALFKALNESKVKNLTVIGGTMAGTDCAFGPLARDGQIKKAITTYVGENPVFTDMLFRGKFEVEFCPMGSLIDRIRAAGAGLPAFYTPTGYGTAVSQGALPSRFTSDGSMTPAEFTEPRETRMFNGRWCTLETALYADYAFVRAWKADTRGNLVFRGTTRNFNVASAKCAKVCIAEVEEIVEAGELDPNEIHLPGVYVHRLVHPEHPEKRVESLVVRKPGETKVAGGKNDDSVRHHICRRAALEVREGMNLNLGIGVPMLVASYLPPSADVMLQSENGLLGLGPHPFSDEVDFDFTNAGKQTVTVTKNGASLFDSVESFAMIRGGHMDLTMLGALQVSSRGDIASWFAPGKKLNGMGGAMDLVVSGCKVIALMNHSTAHGHPRVVDKCSAPLTGVQCIDMLITELAAFVFIPNANGMRQMILTELAEGVTLEEIKAKTDARFAVSPDLKTMPLAPQL